MVSLVVASGPEPGLFWWRARRWCCEPPARACTSPVARPCGALLVAQVDVCQRAVGAERLQVRGGRERRVEDERVAVDVAQVRAEHRAHQLPDGLAQRALTGGQRGLQLACH